MEEKIRYNKYLGSAGVCSRREADRLIASGQVTVNGKQADMGMRVTSADEIQIRERRSGFRRKKYCC